MMLSAQAAAGGQAPAGWPAGAEMLRGGTGSSPQQLQGAHAGLGIGGAGSSPPGQDIPAVRGGHSDTSSAASQQTSLFPRFSPEAADVYAASGSAAQQQAAAAAAQHQQQAALKQNLQKLYGSLGLQHGSRSSLPDIQEDEPQTSLPSDPPLAARLPPFGRPPAARALSDDDLFGMQDLSGGGAGGATSGGMAPPQGLPGQPAAADLSLVGQLPAGQSQSRTLFVRNVDPAVPEDELRTLFEAFGEVRSLYTAAKARGFVVVSYYDTRAATLAKHTLSGQALGGQQLDVHFSLPKDDREAAQGTLLVASLDASSGRQDILYLFSQYGELREVRDDPARPNCCLVEFYDTRHAATALQAIGQAPEMSGRLLVMEAGAAALAQAPQHAAAAPQQAPPGAGLGSSLSHDYLSGLSAAPQPGGGAQYGGPAPGLGMRNVGSSPALLYGSTHGSSNQLDYLLAGGGAPAVPGLGMQQQTGPGGAGGGYPDPAAQLLSSLSASADPLAGMNRSFSEMSLDSGSVAPGMGSRYAAASLSTGDLLAMTQGLPGAGAPGPSGGVAGLRGIASTGSIWPQAHASLGSSPVGAAGMWPGALGAAHGSHGSLQDLLQKQAVSAALQQQAAAVNAALLQQPALVQNAALQAAMQQALLQQQAAALLGHGGLGAAGLLTGRRVAEPPLGGRLARRPLDPVAEAERRMQQEKLYSLDLNKIRSGDDKRTTLMVKNIPNKYTQKMLLALVEERFRGMFDFFYLPIDFKNKCNVGYAFINMVRPEYIIPFVEELHGKKWPKFNSEKICHIAYGRIQGKVALVQHFQNSSLLHEDKRCRPILFHSDGALAGEVEQFPGTLPSPSITPAPQAGAGAAGGSVPIMAAATAAAAPAAPAAPAAAAPVGQQAVPQQHAPPAAAAEA